MNDNTSLSVGLFGFGTIGVGTARLLQTNATIIREKTGKNITLKKIVDIDITTDRGISLPDGTLSTDRADILDDPEISIVIELIGGSGIARELVSQALSKGKHVVTANKELIAKYGDELIALARANNVQLLYEASVGGGIPILTPLLTCLRGNTINRVLGIVNGTTNFILTQMDQLGADFAPTLREAQSRGYAEANPTNDIEGFDTRYKAVILASVAFGKRVSVDDVYKEGITAVSRQEMACARKLGYRIKLLAILENGADSIDVRVHPVLIPAEHPLASINGVLNAVYLEGTPIGPLMFVGEGAGPSATSSAIAGDIISLAVSPSDAPGAGPWDTFSPTPLKPVDHVTNAFYLRMTVEDRPGVLAEISHAFGAAGVSIHSMFQNPTSGTSDVDIVWLTHTTPEGKLNLALDDIRKLPCVRCVASVIRVLDPK